MQQYPPGTQEKYNSFQSKIRVMEDGMKKGIDERWGGVWNPALLDSDEGVWNPRSGF